MLFVIEFRLLSLFINLKKMIGFAYTMAYFIAENILYKFILSNIKSKVSSA